VIDRIVGVWNTDSVGGFSQKINGQTLPAATKEYLPAAYNLVAQDQFRPNFLAIISDNRSVALVNHYNSTATRCGIPLKVLSFVLPMTGAAACDYSSALIDYCRSDHMRFWEKGVVSVHLTDTYEFRNRCYHKACENWSALGVDNWKFLVQFTAVLVQSVYDTVAK